MFLYMPTVNTSFITNSPAASYYFTVFIVGRYLFKLFVHCKTLSITYLHNLHSYIAHIHNSIHSHTFTLYAPNTQIIKALTFRRQTKHTYSFQTTYILVTINTNHLNQTLHKSITPIRKFYTFKECFYKTDIHLYTRKSSFNFVQLAFKKSSHGCCDYLTMTSSLFFNLYE